MSYSKSQIVCSTAVWQQGDYYDHIGKLRRLHVFQFEKGHGHKSLKTRQHARDSLVLHGISSKTSKVSCSRNRLELPMILIYDRLIYD